MTTKTVYIVVQEGGSSLEAYASSYDTEGAALDAMAGHTRATYRSKGPFQITLHEINGKAFFEEVDVLGLFDAMAPVKFEYVDGVEVGADADEEE